MQGTAGGTAVRSVRDLRSSPQEERGERYFRSLVENATDLIALVDSGGVVKYVNAAVAGVLGYPPAERIGRSLFELFHPEEVLSVVSAFFNFVRGSGEWEPAEYRVLHRDGSWRVLELTAVSLLADGDSGGVVLNARDVTDRKQAQEARSQLAAILDATPDFVSTCDAHGRTLYVNRALRTLLGIEGEDGFRHHDLPDFYPPWAGDILRNEALPGAVREGVWSAELAILTRGGEEVPVSLVIVAHRTASGGVHFLSATARDITESKRAGMDLQDSEQRFRQVAENIEEVFWLIDRAEWQALFVSPAFETVWGRSCGTLHLRLESLLEDVHPEDREGAGSLEEFFLGESEREYRILRPDGSVRWIRSRTFPVRNPEGEVYRVAGISEDVTERKEAQQQLVRAAMHDALTGLPNRAAFMHRLARSVERSRLHPQNAFSVLFLDLDRFKVINDSLGHGKGDELLVSIARRLEECVRPEDMVARLGGDEFTVLLHHLNELADVVRVARRILERLAEPFQLGDHEVFTGGSIGIVPSQGYQSPEELLRDADIAMYRAKLSGRGRYQVFDAAMHNSAVAQLHLETDLRRAVEREEFRLYFQPIISLATGTIDGFEALVRWEHPVKGLIAPGAFIEVAEETGTIVPMGWWVLREACRHLRAWDERFPELELSVSVNLSGKMFTQRDLVARVVEILRETGVAPHRLRLEITESVIVENSEVVSSMLAQLKELGLHLEMDDFGTGYSSLSYLHRFPIERLKIDRSFVSRMGSEGEGAEIVRTILALGQSLGMVVVAEGVETLAQLQRLRALGCEYAQGYLFSGPVDPEAAEALLLSSPSWAAQASPLLAHGHPSGPCSALTGCSSRSK
jgi:diguanylate cyclase (GGDEF)-like protein/PAS domain S-box-containing protein